MANLPESWDKIRRCVANEGEDALSDDIRSFPDRKFESELFLQSLFYEIEAVLKKEIVRIPNTDKAYAPEKFVVYLGGETDKNLRRDKRKLFARNLSVLIFERARELAGNLRLTVKKICVELAIDPMLKEKIEVRAVSKNGFETVKTTEPIVLSQISGETTDDYGRTEDIRAEFGILYRVEIWQGTRRVNEYPIIQRVNTIGRDDGKKAANLRLPSENRKISRFHAEICLEENGEMWVKALHKNPTIVSDQVIQKGERAKLGADGEIMIYDFTLKVRFEE